MDDPVSYYQAEVKALNNERSDEGAIIQDNEDGLGCAACVRTKRKHDKRAFSDLLPVSAA